MERARELDPFSIIINTELGCPYLYSKRYARAIEYFRKAVEMDPNFPFAHFALAEAYDRVGRYREAWDEHEKAVSVLMETLRQHPLPTYQRPKYPNYHQRLPQ